MKHFMSLVLLTCLVIVNNAPAADQKPNILFLLADDQRPDTIAALGNPRISTPNLDRLVARGVSFRRATCSYPICVISRAEMLSGMHGWENGINAMGGRSFQKDITFWAEALRESGYQTCYVGKWHTTGRPSRYGYGSVRGLFSGGGGKWWKEGQIDWKGTPVTGYRGWIFQDETGKEKYPDLGVGLTPDIDSKFADAAIAEIRSDHGDAPWFLHVNFTGPHDPLFIPPGTEGKYKAEEMMIPPNFTGQHPFDHGNLKGRDEMLLPFPRTGEDVRDLLRVYYSVVDYLDQQVGRIVAALEETGQLENTIIIYSSDHGMGVGSHGLRGKQSQYEHTINVPLIVAGPGVASGVRSDAQVYLRELYPTTCDLAGAEIPESVTGKSFADVLRGKTKQHHGEIFGYFTNHPAHDSRRWLEVHRVSAGGKKPVVRSESGPSREEEPGRGRGSRGAGFPAQETTRPVAKGDRRSSTRGFRRLTGPFPALNEANFFKGLSKPTARWFRATFAGPTEGQTLCVPSILEGKSVLLSSPTGSGKTLAGFLGIIDCLSREHRGGTLPAAGIQCIYVSPLRALAYDIEKNLKQPLEGLGLSEVITVGMRTGDTSSNERARQRRKPPHILITTPESLAIVLPQRGYREALERCRFVIIDELHAFVENKRGAHLSVSLERLERLGERERPLCRIGLSATVLAPRRGG